MEKYEGYLQRVKYHYDKENPKKINGVSLACVKDAYDEKAKFEWFGFWINTEEDMNLFNTYKEIFNNLGNSKPSQHPIAINYEVNQKGFNDVKDFKIKKESKSVVDKAFEDAETVEQKDYEEDSKAFMGETKPEKPLLTQRDTLIARECCVRGTRGIADTGERIKAMKRLMKFIETGG